MQLTKKTDCPLLGHHKLFCRLERLKCWGFINKIGNFSDHKHGTRTPFIPEAAGVSVIPSSEKPLRKGKATLIFAGKAK
jgi:hypothetical protein